MGAPASASSDPVQDWYLVAGLTTNITNNTTNDFHYSYLRNWWAWSRTGAPPQIPGLGGALEFDAGQSLDSGPRPIQRKQSANPPPFLGREDQMFRDDVSMLKGNHLFQFGGTYQHNFNYHQRNDSGGTINAYPVYSLGQRNYRSRNQRTHIPLCHALLPLPVSRALATPLPRRCWGSFPLRRRCLPVLAQI